MNSLGLTDLEGGLRTIEDKLAIYEPIASHPPSAEAVHRFDVATAIPIATSTRPAIRFAVTGSPST